MLQRIQTVFFILILFLAAGLFFFPLYTVEVPNQFERSFYVLDQLSLLLATIFIIVFTGINIFLFRNRPFQMKLGWLTFLLIAVLTILIRLTFREASNDAENFIFTAHFYAYTPFLMLIFKVLAIYFIKKDEQLVRSADRFR